jgi:hypothetical protein
MARGPIYTTSPWLLVQWTRWAPDYIFTLYGHDPQYRAAPQGAHGKSEAWCPCCIFVDFKVTYSTARRDLLYVFLVAVDNCWRLVWGGQQNKLYAYRDAHSPPWRPRREKTHTINYRRIYMTVFCVIYINCMSITRTQKNEQIIKLVWNFLKSL